MARQDKYYGTYIMVYGTKLNNLINRGYSGTHCQFRIVCKAKSMAEANRIAESYGLYKKCFIAEYTSETGNALELELADKFGFIISTDGTQCRNYIDIKEII